MNKIHAIIIDLEKGEATALSREVVETVDGDFIPMKGTHTSTTKISNDMRFRVPSANGRSMSTVRFKDIPGVGSAVNQK